MTVFAQACDLSVPEPRDGSCPGTGDTLGGMWSLGWAAGKLGCGEGGLRRGVLSAEWDGTPGVGG